MKKIPDIKTDITDGYANIIASNFDTIQESFATHIPPELVDRLNFGQKMARELHEGQGTSFGFADRWMQIWSGGSQGNRWVLEDDDIQIHIRTEKDGYNINVRYKSAGLWEHGADKLREAVQEALLQEIKPLKEDWISLTRVDYAMDFYSPSFSGEMLSRIIADNMLLTSGVKAGLVFTSTGNETLTIGMNRKGLQIQVYDKGKEITQASGKFWMFKVWEREGYYPPDDLKARDVWRVEVRFGKDFMKDRNIRTYEQFREKMNNLLSEAVMRRRMIDSKGRETHKERLPLHPLWAAVFHECGAAGEYEPVGRQITMCRGEYIEMLQKQTAGITRALAVLENGCFKTEHTNKIFNDTLNTIRFDMSHHEKVMKCRERYLFLDEAK